MKQNKKYKSIHFHQAKKVLLSKGHKSLSIK